jgi:hypothetical protein
MPRKKRSAAPNSEWKPPPGVSKHREQLSKLAQFVQKRMGLMEPPDYYTALEGKQYIIFSGMTQLT